MHEYNVKSLWVYAFGSEAGLTMKIPADACKGGYACIEAGRYNAGQRASSGGLNKAAAAWHYRMEAGRQAGRQHERRVGQV